MYTKTRNYLHLLYYYLHFGWNSVKGGAVKDVHGRIKLILKPLDFSIFESFPALIHGRWFGFGLTW